MQCEETGDCPQAMVQRVPDGMRRPALCLRSHGVPNWPGPTVDSEGRPGFNLLHVPGFNPEFAADRRQVAGMRARDAGGAPGFH